MFFDEDMDERSLQLAETPPFLTQIVTSQFDADRSDYLLRDSYATGTDYGRFDLEWLLQHLLVDEEKGRFYLGHKALFAAEAYVYARYHMYRTVYFHKTTRAAEVMLRLLFRRYRNLCQADAARDVSQFAPGAPTPISRAFSGALNLDEYLELDDHSITEFTKACSRGADPTLAYLARGLLNRRLFNATDVTQVLQPHVVEFSEVAKDCIRKAGFDAEQVFTHDAPADTPYKLYVPDAERPAMQIYVEMPGRGPTELSDCSDSVKQIANRKYTLVRYYYPPETRDAIRESAEPKLEGENR